MKSLVASASFCVFSLTFLTALVGCGLDSRTVDEPAQITASQNEAIEQDENELSTEEGHEFSLRPNPQYIARNVQYTTVAIVYGQPPRNSSGSSALTDTVLRNNSSIKSQLLAATGGAKVYKKSGKKCLAQSPTASDMAIVSGSGTYSCSFKLSSLNSVTVTCLHKFPQVTFKLLNKC